MAKVTTIARSRDSLTALSGLGPGLRSAALAAALALSALPAVAQEATPAIVNPANAVVTGFSGTIPGQAPAGGDPSDYLAIDLNGPSARVIDLSTLAAQGQLSQVAKPFAVTASQVGEVFGVALDGAPQPNVYLAATSAYGISLYVPDQSGVIKRIHTGASGAQFLPGQFGPPDQGGGPGSIWRINGITGEVTLFSTIDSAAQGVAALGGLAFDPRTQQLFVAERGSGLIHRLTLDGADRGTFDHGADGRPAAGLAPFPQGPAAAIDIGNPAFDTANPSTWGFAAPARRVFGLAVWKDRLYYAVAEGPQVWSIGIGQDGAFTSDVRLEADVPALQDGVEIASITFNGLGNMYVAERGAVTGDYQLTNLASEGASRVLRFVPQPAGDTSPGQWRPQPDQYAIGLPQPYNNANGGVALGYGYQQDGALDIGACRATVWSTGERLLDPGDPNAAPGSYPAIDGLQGNSSDLVEPQNEPPTNAWFIDYSDQPSNPLFRGYMGAIQILSPCSEQGAYVPPPPPPPPPPVLRCPPGSIYEGGQCVVTVSCPPGSVYRNGYCVFESCPPGYVRYRNRCVPPPQVCPSGTAFDDGRCVPVGCPPGMVQLPSGYCACPPGIYYYNGRCVPPSSCPPGMVTLPGGICWCPLNTYFVAGQCIPNYCPPGYYRRGGQCVPKFCQPGYEFGPDGFCHPRFNPCPPDQMPYLNYCVPRFCQPGAFRGNDGYCYPYGNTCGPGQEFFGGRCVTACLPLFKRDLGGICINIVEFDRKQNLCQGGKIRIGNACACPPDKQEGPNGVCVPKGAPRILLEKIQCPPGKQLQGAQCVPIQCPQGQQVRGNQCAPIQCPQGEQVRGNACVAIQCPQGQEVRGNACVPIQCPQGEQVRGNACVAMQCPQGQQLKGSQCVPIQCPQGEQVRGNACVAIQCPQGQELRGSQCVAIQCPPGEQVHGNACVAIQCPQGQELRGSQCVPIQCPQGEQVRGNACVAIQCPQGQELRGSQCAAIQCPQGEELRGNSCVAKQCPPGQELRGGQCVAKPQEQKVVQCPPGQEPRGTQCVPVQCPPGQELQGGQCVPKPPEKKVVQCPPGQEPRGTQCVPVQCPPGQELQGVQCVPKPQEKKVVQCPPGQQPRGTECVPISCPPGEELRGAQCVPKPEEKKVVQCPPGQQPRGAECVPISCPPGEELKGAQCVPKPPEKKVVQCPPGQQPRGTECVPISCLPSEELKGSQCVPKPQGQGQGQQPSKLVCTGGKVPVKGQCECPRGTKPAPGDKCVKG